MWIAILASASAAIALRPTLFDPSACRSGNAAPSRAQGSEHDGQTNRKTAHAASCQEVTTRRRLKVEKKIITKTPLIGTGSAAAFAKKGGTQLKFKGLPITPAVASTSLRAGRLGAAAECFKPKLTLAKAPKAQFQYRLAPFVQRHWKKAFFWVAVAGFGYLTIPEIYYDRFLGYVARRSRL